MPKLAALALFLASQAIGGDFRTLNFGEPCDDVVSREGALGSIRKEWPAVEGAEMYAFEGEEFGVRLTFGYLCVRGALLSGNYFFPSGDLSSALANFETAHERLVATYGPPVSDSSRWMQPLDRRWLQAEPAKYSTTWKSSRVWVELNILSVLEEVEPRWRVVVMLAKPSSP